MIAQEESGLTQEQYSALMSATGELAVQVTVRQYGPVWSEHSVSDCSDAFDAAVADQHILRAYISEDGQLGVDLLPPGGAEWESVPCTMPDADPSVPPTIGVDGASVAVFYFADGEIRRVVCADVRDCAFDSWEVICANDTVRWLAAVSTSELHFAFASAKHNRILARAVNSPGGWEIAVSDLYWPFPITGFDAVRLENGTVAVLMSTELPPLISSRAVGDGVKHENSRVQGIVSVRVSQRRWSDVLVSDAVDAAETDDARGWLRASIHNGMIFATYKRAVGRKAGAIETCSVSRSTDAVAFEFPERVVCQRGKEPSVPFVIVSRDDGVYAVSPKRTLYSPPCVWAAHDVAEDDYTDHVSRLTSSAAEIRESDVVLSNADGALPLPPPDTSARLQIVHRLGYRIDGTPVRVQVSVEDVVSYSNRKALPTNHVLLHSLDVLGRVNRVQSDNAAEWPGIQGGYDCYADLTGTGYGGLRHTAVYKGSWRTPGDGTLELLSNRSEGLAISTFVNDALCGSVSAAVAVNPYEGSNNDGEYAGVVFRAHDKDNYYAVLYDADSDRIRMIRCLSGDKSVLAESSPMGWERGSFHYIKVVVHYSLVYVYVSDDGASWEELLWSTGDGELDGMADTVASRFSGAVAWTGKFGVIGFGYSSEDEWPSWTPAPWPPPGPDMPPVPKRVVAWSRAEVAYTDTFDTDYPSWVNVAPSGVEHISRVFMDANGKAAWLISGNDGYSTDQGVWYTPDITAPGSWSLVLSQAEAEAMAAAVTSSPRGTDWNKLATGVSFGDGMFVAVERKWGGAGDHTGSFIFTSTDAGASWSVHDELTGDGSFHFYARQYFWYGTQMVAYLSGSGIYIVGAISSGWRNAYAYSPDAQSWVVYYDDNSLGAGGFRSVGIAGSVLCALVESSQEIVRLADWGVIDANMYCTALNSYHPRAMFAQQSDEDNPDIGYLWRDGLKLKSCHGLFGSGRDSAGGLAAWYNGVDKVVLVDGGDTESPPVVLWYDGGLIRDKTGNLLTVTGWSGKDPGKYDNCGVLFVG